MIGSVEAASCRFPPARAITGPSNNAARCRVYVGRERWNGRPAEKFDEAFKPC
jgi:hypothetical protein